jgi:hypothetical protein
MNMRHAGWLGCALVLALVAGCGGDDEDNDPLGGDGDGDGTTQKFACDIGSGTDQHYCYEWSWNGPANAVDAYTDVCREGGAMTVQSCPAAGKVGGCKYSVTSGNVTVTWIGWFYFGNAAENMQFCVSSGGVTATWVNP